MCSKYLISTPYDSVALYRTISKRLFHFLGFYELNVPPVLLYTKQDTFISYIVRILGAFLDNTF